MHEGYEGTYSNEPSMPSTALGLKILLVEDDPDTRDLLEEFFSTNGYTVVAVDSAEDALDALRDESIDLVVSDNQLEGDNTGSWMLREARTTGLLRNVGALMYTGDRHLDVPEGVRVLQKPTALDDLERAAEEALVRARGREVSRAADARRERSANSGSLPHVELILYVTDSSCSLRAVRNLERILASFDRAHVHLRLCDLSKEPAAPAAEDDQIAFVPTLVKRSPGRAERLLGDLENAGAVVDMLASCGVKGDNEPIREDRDRREGSGRPDSRRAPQGPHDADHRSQRNG